jgi:hypothetical protein
METPREIPGQVVLVTGQENYAGAVPTNHLTYFGTGHRALIATPILKT